ncbi:MAG: glutathione S-transferase family protein [Trichocoleus desertorum ATA4-8-CV12]|nr:glutathione S-transferase family protein [Trichocoleus desertorum ATA4-8-CV12]
MSQPTPTPTPSSESKPASSNTTKKKRRALPPKLIIQLGKFTWSTMWHLMMSQLAPRNQSGAYVRPSSQFRHVIGTAADNPYQPATGRYKLYVGLGCPWAHRTLVVRTLKQLEDAIAITIVSPSPTEGGWVLNQSELGCRSLADLYELAQPGYSGRCTVPVLWDTETNTIVNNESAEIIVILNSELNQFTQQATLDLYPSDLQEKINIWDEKTYDAVNNGVYRCGFAQTQAAYQQACEELFAALDEIDAALEINRYLCGDRLTLADIRLFTTLFRFDVVYYGLFKCNQRRIQDYKNLGPYLRDLYQLPGVADTCNLEAVKQDYYGNLFPLNPGGIIPLGPDITNLLEPHDRDRLSK